MIEKLRIRSVGTCSTPQSDQRVEQSCPARHVELAQLHALRKVVPWRLLHHRRSEVGLQQALLRKALGESYATVLCMTVSATPEPNVGVLARAWRSKLMGK